MNPLTPLDQKLYEIFSSAPQLHDVFRVAKERGYAMQQFQGYGNGSSDHLLIILHSGNTAIDYNPTLPLLSQSDETKSALISLF